MGAWSMPFVIEKVTEMLYYLLQQSADEEANPASLERLEQEVFAGKLRHQLSNDSLSPEQKSVVQLVTGLARQSSGDGDPIADKMEDRDRIRKKVRTVAKMARMLKTLRQENETIVQLKGICPGHKLKPGMLLAVQDNRVSDQEHFNHALELDVENELRPGEVHRNESIK